MVNCATNDVLFKVEAPQAFSASGLQLTDVVVDTALTPFTTFRDTQVLVLPRQPVLVIPVELPQINRGTNFAVRTITCDGTSGVPDP